MTCCGSLVRTMNVPGRQQLDLGPSLNCRSRVASSEELVSNKVRALSKRLWLLRSTEACGNLAVEDVPPLRMPSQPWSTQATQTLHRFSQSTCVRLV